jgi:hypothetical protein
LPAVSGPIATGGCATSLRSAITFSVCPPVAPPCNQNVSEPNASVGMAACCRYSASKASASTAIAVEPVCTVAVLPVFTAAQLQLFQPLTSASP